MTEFDNIKKYIIAALLSYKISPTDTRVSIVMYGGEKSMLSVNFNQGISKESIEYKLNQATLTNNDSQLESALEFVDSDVFSVLSGSKPNTKKIIVIFARKNLKVLDADKMSSSVLILKRKDIKLIIVGLGNVDEEVLKIATDGDKVISVVTDDKLPESLGNLESLVALLSSEYMCVLLSIPINCSILF